MEGPGLSQPPDLALESFEGTFPEPFWFVGDLTPADGEVFWDRVSCGSPFEGSSHAWSAGQGGIQPCVAYLNNADAIMFVEAEYLGRSFDNTDFITLAVKQQIAGPADFGYIYIQGYATPPPHGERGSPVAEGFCIFNDIPGDCRTPTEISPYAVLPIRLGSAFDSANFVRVIIGFHSDGSEVSGGTFVDTIDFHQSPGHQIFPIPGGFPRVLSVSVTGSGTVTSSPSGIMCPPDCSEAYLRGTLVILTATPAEGWTFAGWGGACEGQGNPCSLTMDADKAVTATFTRVETFLLSVTVLGDGVVTSSPSGIMCPPDCSEAYLRGTLVILTATPAEGWTFAGWGGACEGQGNPCSLTMDADKAVTALFALPGPDLTGRLGFFPICPPKSLDVLVFTAHISNIGSEATASPFTVKFYLSDDDVLNAGDTLLLAKDVMESIPPGETKPVPGAIRVQRPFLDKFIIVKVDFPDDVNQGNNIVPQRIPCP